jgi:hypothetical protein
MGDWKQRDLVLGALQDLPKATVAHDDEVLQYISIRRLFGLGIGYVEPCLGAVMDSQAAHGSSISRGVGTAISIHAEIHFPTEA